MSTPDKKKRSQANENPGSDDEGLFDVDTGDDGKVRNGTRESAKGIGPIVVTWGPEKFSPIQFHMLDLGPFTATVTPKDGETVVEAMRRANRELDRFAQEQFKIRLKDYLVRVKQVAKAVRENRAT